MFRNSMPKGVLLSMALLLVAGLAVAFVPGSGKEVTSLMEGNKRFVAGASAQADIGAARRQTLAGGQKPQAIVVTCSDSRVSPEHIFNQGLGDVFVIRTAGNVADAVALGSIEYAAEHLHAPLLMILGHEKCGAVAAAVESTGKPEGNIGAIVEKILPAVKRAKAAGGDKNALLGNAILENIAETHATVVRKSPILKHLVDEGKLTVVEAVYSLASGEVKVLSQTAQKAGAPKAH